MQSQTQKGYLFLVIVLVLAGLSGWLYQSKDFSYGLDVRGGTRLTLQMKYDADPVKAAEQMKNRRSNQSKLLKILEARVAQNLGVTEGTVAAKGEDEFIIEIPGVKDIDKARQIITTTASLHAYHAQNVNTRLVNFRPYSEGKISGDKDNPYYTFTATANPSKELTPKDPEYQRMISGWKEILVGDDLAKAGYSVSAASSVQPNFTFSADGAKKMEAWSRSVMNRSELLAFVLDGRVLSIAPLKDGAILQDEAFIDGQFDPAYVKSLTTLLNAGALPINLTETSSAVVDPTIGKGAFDQMVKAGAYAMGFIIIFLLGYYAFPGLVAMVALGLYILFTLTVMKLIGATMSLSALAGFILSIGMAVDANVLVFERMKEEMREGRSLMTAVELGFKRAFPAILDSNACTILTSLVLSILGTGMVKGFATTLILGVLISLFTAVTCTRSLLVFLVGSGIGNNAKLFAADRSMFGKGFEAKAAETPLPVMQKYKKWFAYSIITVIPGLIFFFMGGLKPNVEFSGGIEAEYLQAKSATLDTALIERNLTAKGFKGSIIKVSNTDSNKILAATVKPADDAHKDITDENARRAAINQDVVDGIGLGTPSSYQEIGPTIQAETVRNAILGVMISSALIVLYLAFRFGIALGGFKNGMKFGLSAIGALVHDVLVVGGIAAIVGYFLNWQVSSLFFTAMLTVIGFSVHDTIVIFDRIRENLRRPLAGEDFLHLCNRSVSTSFTRSIITSLTVISTLVILVIWGTPTVDLKFFCVTMLAGILSGTYSSIYNAAPILWIWDRAIVKSKGEDKGFMGEAIRESNRMRAAQATAMANTADNSFGTVTRRRSVRDQAKREIDN